MKFILALAALAGCYLKSYPVTPAVSEESTYECVARGAQGTCWAAAPGWVVTAGHMCVHYMADPGDGFFLKTRAGMLFQGRPVEWEQSSGPEADLCVLKVDVSGRPLILADQEPMPGTPDGLVAYPDGVKTVSSGLYQGHGETSAYADHGSSGGAVFTARGVYGICVQARRSPSGDQVPGCALTPVAEIKRVLRDVGARYVVTPDDPGIGDPFTPDPTAG